MFSDRSDAGRQLAQRLAPWRGQPELVVVGLPRGGVPVAAEVADALLAPLDAIVVRKLGVPGHPELGLGAIGEGGVRVINEAIVRLTGVSDAEITEIENHERVELERRASRLRRGRERIALEGQTVVIVDDGIATGSTARAACQVARAEGAESVVLAVPVAPSDWAYRLGNVADELVCVDTPRNFHAVGQAYGDFTQTTDAEVVKLLERADEA